MHKDGLEVPHKQFHEQKTVSYLSIYKRICWPGDGDATETLTLAQVIFVN